jgi:hypothetical protein
MTCEDIEAFDPFCHDEVIPVFANRRPPTDSSDDQNHLRTSTAHLAQFRIEPEAIDITIHFLISHEMILLR